jgi:hypothetical protein
VRLTKLATASRMCRACGRRIEYRRKAREGEWGRARKPLTKLRRRADRARRGPGRTEVMYPLAVWAGRRMSIWLNWL